MAVKEALTHNWIKKYFPELVEKKLDISNKENIEQEGDISFNKLIEKSDNE